MSTQERTEGFPIRYRGHSFRVTKRMARCRPPKFATSASTSFRFPTTRRTRYASSAADSRRRYHHRPRHLRHERRLLQTGSAGQGCRGSRQAHRWSTRARPGNLESYVEQEFKAAELPFPTAGRRVDHLDHVTRYIRDQLPDIPVMIAGSGDRVLTLAAQRTHQSSDSPAANPEALAEDPLADRSRLRRTVAGGTASTASELNLCITVRPENDNGRPDLGIPAEAFHTSPTTNCSVYPPCCKDR